MKRRLNPIKSALVLALRGATPEEIVRSGSILDAIAHPSDDSQYLEIYWYQNYVWVVVIGKQPPRLITAYKSRKLKRRYRP